MFIIHLFEGFVILMAPLFDCCLPHQRGVNQTLTQTHCTAYNYAATLHSAQCTLAQKSGGQCEIFSEMFGTGI